MSKFIAKSIEDYHQLYKESIDAPEKFWSDFADQEFTWKEKWSQVLDFDLSKPEVNWFKGAKLNITENCIDRHLDTKGNQTAILFEPNSTQETALH
ncbi:MAG: acetyl-coenzyme A synthetase, partial [Bacteroidia bacterium]|nr:acetyl-coenzyme A synthetase [Bacteroidia bacterium]